jgi:undecaprenyl-diphosphatase
VKETVPCVGALIASTGRPSPTASHLPPRAQQEVEAAQDGKPLAMALLWVAAAVAAFAVLTAAGLLLVHALGGVTRWDESVNAWVVRHRTGSDDTGAHWGTFTANTMGIVVVALVVSAFGAIRRWGRLLLLLPLGLALELTVFLAVNETVRRPRPTVQHLGSTPSTFSFPSGHVAATLVLYGGLMLLARARGAHKALVALTTALAVLVPLWVAASRVYQGQHHLLDVIAGAFLGAWALLVAAWLAGVDLRPSAQHRRELERQPQEAIR